jgi:hypothetical protein
MYAHLFTEKDAKYLAIRIGTYLNDLKASVVQSFNMSLPEPSLATARIFFEKRDFENCNELFRSREVLECDGINVHGVFENRQFSGKKMEEGNESRGSEVFNNVTIRKTKLKETKKFEFDWDIMAPLLMNLEQKTKEDSKKCSSSNCSKEGKIFLCFKCGFISGTKITGTYHMRKSHLDISTTLDLFCHDCSVVATIKVKNYYFANFSIKISRPWSNLRTRAGLLGDF